MHTFKLPDPIRRLVLARDGLKEYYCTMLNKAESEAELHFTLDGNLVGDIGEAIAVELFGVKLVTAKSVAGIDGYAPDGKTTVQVKVTGTGRGPAFRQTETRADHLLFFDLDFENLSGTVVFNGPEHYAVSKLPETFSGQRSLTARQIRQADELVPENKRLQIVSIHS